MNSIALKFKINLIILLTFFSLSAISQNSESKLLLNVTSDLFDSLIDVRNHLHTHPELSGQEKNTSLYIKNYLQNLGLEVIPNIGGYSLVGILKGEKPGRKIAYRADIDAIPVHRHNNEYSKLASENVAHQCGHDVHTTIALGIAKLLSSQREQLKGTVYFIFQASEENFKGAKAMINDNLFDKIKPDEIYAAHLSPMPVGLIASKPGYLFADYKQINLKFKKGEDQKELQKYVENLLKGLQNVDEEGPFWQKESLLNPNIGLGNPNTIFKNFITVENNFIVTEEKSHIIINGFLSTSNAELMESIPQQLTTRIAGSSYADQLINIKFQSDQIAFSNDRGNVNNDPELVEKSLESLSTLSTKSINGVLLYGVMPDGRGDDFSYFQQEIPGVYFFIGGSNFKKGIISMPHSPDFKVDKSVIKIGVEAFSQLIVDRLEYR